MYRRASRNDKKRLTEGGEVSGAKGLADHLKIIIIPGSFFFAFPGTMARLIELMDKKAMLHCWVVAESNKIARNADCSI